MDKIKMITPLVEMDGDEMTRILWQMIKDELLLPFIDLKTEYYDLGLEHRNETIEMDCQDVKACPSLRFLDFLPLLPGKYGTSHFLPYCHRH